MIFIVDGYNVIHAIPQFEKQLRGGLQGARDLLIAGCQRLGGSKKEVEDVWIIFDGASDLYCTEERPFPKIKLVYTRTHEDADDRIIDILRAYRGKSPVTVVTNDNYVSNHSRSLGARVISAAEFQNCLAGPKRAAGKSPEKPCPKLSDRAARNITEEYRQILGIDH